MVDRGANIDIVFRNGLKDFEVLPPAEVWNKIQPVIKTRRSYLTAIQFAAAIAVFATISLLAYRWGAEVSRDQFPEMLAESQESVSPALYSAPSVITDHPAINSNVSSFKQETLVPETEITIAESGNVPEIVSENTSISVRQDLVADYQSFPGIQNPPGKKYPKVNSPALEPADYQFITEDIVMPVMERWSITAMASPTYYSQFASSGNDLAQQIMASDENRVSYSGGVGLAYNINNRFSIQSGLYYSSVGQEMSGVSAYSGFQKYDYSKGDHNFEVLTTNGTIATNNADIFLSSHNLPERIITNYTIDVFDPVKANLDYVSSTIYQDMSFLELPVIVRYKVVDRKVDINLIGGMSYNFLVNNTVYALLENGKYPVGTTEGLNAVSLSSSLGMGMEYKFSRSLSLNLEPTFRYYINPFNSAKANGFHPYSIGIFSGIAYRF